MYYYYYYREPETIKINLKLTLSKGGEDIQLEELTSFLDAISQLHKRVLFITQPEYEKDNSIDVIDNRVLLNYHSLNIEKIEMNSPLTISLSFFCLPETLSSYVVLIRFLLKICKRYGKDTSAFQKTIQSIISEVKNWDKYLKMRIRNEIINKILGYYENQESSIESFAKDLEQLTKKFVTNEKCSTLYNFLCSTAIAIDHIMLFSNELGDNFSLYSKEE